MLQINTPHNGNDDNGNAAIQKGQMALYKHMSTDEQRACKGTIRWRYSAFQWIHRVGSIVKSRKGQQFTQRMTLKQLEERECCAADKKSQLVG